MVVMLLQVRWPGGPGGRTQPGDQALPKLFEVLRFPSGFRIAVRHQVVTKGWLTGTSA